MQDIDISKIDKSFSVISEKYKELNSELLKEADFIIAELLKNLSKIL